MACPANLDFDISSSRFFHHSRCTGHKTVRSGYHLLFLPLALDFWTLVKGFEHQNRPTSGDRSGVESVDADGPDPRRLEAPSDASIFSQTLTKS
jgi:hypothetical protein